MTEPKKDDTDPVVRRMLANWKLADSAESDNRKRGLAALRFRQGGKDQWDDKMYTFRQNDNRPTESYNQIPQFIHQITNDLRMNMPQTRFIPGNDGSKEVAEIYEDLARAIQSSSEGEVAYDTASDSIVTIGWGYWRYITEYESNKGFDQIIKVVWVPNSFAIYDDPNSMEADFSDRRFLIHVADMAVDDFNRDYGKNYDAIELQGIGNSQPAWATEDMVRIAEYWEVTNTKETIKRTVNGKEEEREVITPKVMWYKCTATEVLDRKEWQGVYIPYVRVSGERLDIDGKTYYSGLVENLMAPQKQYNYWSNAATEMVALAPKAPYIAAIGQIEGLEDIWNNANLKNYPYLPYKPTALNGALVGPPQRNQTSADIGSMLALVQQAQQNFYTTSGIYPASLGQQSNETSGKAINARKIEGDVSTYHFGDNVARALRFGGRILKDLFPKIYDGARSVRLLKEDKTHREVKINQEFEDEDGEVKMFDMTQGDYDVMVTTGPSFTTKRQEAAESMTQIIQAAPQLMEIAGDLLIGNMDWPGADKLAERLKKTLPPGLADEPKKGQIPPQVQAQLQQAQMIIEQLGQQLQAAQQELQSKQAENEAKMADVQVKMAEMQQRGQSEQIKAQLDQQKLALDAEKIQLDREKLQLEAAKIQLDFHKGQAEQIQKPAEGGEDMQLSKEALMAQLQTLEQQEVAKQQEQITMQEQQAMEMQARMDKEAEDRARSDALLQGLTGIQAMLGQLTASITAPKQVVRDPQTGLVSGVVTV